jgi:hypothetical protein
LISFSVIPTYAAEKTSIAEVQDEICKVGGKLEELGKQTQEDIQGGEDTSMEGERVSFEGEGTAVTDGTPALAMWMMQQHGATNWPRKSFLR